MPQCLIEQVSEDISSSKKYPPSAFTLDQSVFSPTRSSAQWTLFQIKISALMVRGMLSHETYGIYGHLFKKDGEEPGDHGPLIYLSVQGRLDQAIALVESNGGRVLQHHHDMGPYESRAVVQDSEGNRLALHSVGDGPSSTDRENRAREYVFELYRHYREYHNHKETMAYAGITLCMTAFTIALTMKDWPPSWGTYSKCLTLVAITVAWFAMGFYLRYQLHKRRWAAIRVAGIHRLLAKWISDPPQKTELIPWTKQNAEESAQMAIVDWFWWCRPDSVTVVKVSENVYPTALVEVWLAQANKTDASHRLKVEDPAHSVGPKQLADKPAPKKRATEALEHEILINIVWLVLYIFLVIRTVFLPTSTDIPSSILPKGSGSNQLRTLPSTDIPPFDPIVPGGY